MANIGLKNAIALFSSEINLQGYKCGNLTFCPKIKQTFWLDFSRSHLKAVLLRPYLNLGQKVRFPHLNTSILKCVGALPSPQSSHSQTMSCRIGIVWCMHSTFNARSHYFQGSKAARCEHMLWCKPRWVATSYKASYAPYVKIIKRFNHYFDTNSKFPLIRTYPRRSLVTMFYFMIRDVCTTTRTCRMQLSL